ncbi:hypothetical protein IWX90DRAFT_116353 [Phyllosticta citrichinensis]|uniref:Uncharacterized protein n=1 Tax=Phyllosticta citrichinensis TaxID=1130410 RepID=A0ABR1Y327_9PEZI
MENEVRARLHHTAPRNEIWAETDDKRHNIRASVEAGRRHTMRNTRQTTWEVDQDERRNTVACSICIGHSIPILMAFSMWILTHSLILPSFFGGIWSSPFFLLGLLPLIFFVFFPPASLPPCGFSITSYHHHHHHYHGCCIQFDSVYKHSCYTYA